MHETKAKIEKICDLEKTITQWVEGAVNCGQAAVDTKELGEAIDMIKDLAEAKEKLWKACYYKCLVEDMYDDGQEERMGYDHYRYESGRFAPKGRGHRSYYTPTDDEGHNDGWYLSRVANYTPTRENFGMDRLERMTNGGMKQHPYDKYSEARRHYTDTHDAESKAKMDMFADEHLRESITTLKEIWADAEPSSRMKMKNELVAMVNSMNV